MSSLTEREYRYWLAKNGDRRNNNVIYANLSVLLSTNKDIEFDRSKVQYIYFTGIEDSSLNFITLFQYDAHYALLDYTDNVVSMCMDTNIDIVLQQLTPEKRTQCRITLRHQAKLSPAEIDALKGVVPTDFISSTEKSDLFKRYVADRPNIDLSGLYTLSPEDILGTFPHKEIIMYQNPLFTHFEWLVKFPQATLLSIWYADSITDKKLSEIPAQILTLELHGLPSITEMAIYEIPHTVKKLIVDSNLICCPSGQSCSDSVKINTSLEFLVLNNTSLTKDYIQTLVQHFTGLTHLFLPENVFRPDLGGDSKLIIGKC